MTKLRGTNEIFLGGKKRPIKFGTAQTAIFCELRGNISIKDAQALLSKEKVMKQDIEPKVLLQFYYSALESGARAAKQEIDFDIYDVADWLDENPQAMAEMQNTAAGAVSPNGPAQMSASAPAPAA